MLLTCGALGFVVYRSAIQLAMEGFDLELAEQASSIATRFQMKGGSLDVDMPQAALDILTYDLSDQFYFEVHGPHGHHIAGNTTAFPPVPPRLKVTDRPAFYNGVLNQIPVRVAILELPVQMGAKEYATVQVAETLTGRQTFERKIIVSIVTTEVVFLGLLFGVLYSGIARALRPLGILTESVDRREANDLNALPTEAVPREISPLIVAINRLLARVNSDLEMRHRFIANAAHQLRTPLAGLQTQSELALRTTDETERGRILEKIRIGCERAARVVNQLLVLAKFDPNSGGIAKTSVELQSLVESTIEEFEPIAAEKRIKLQFQAPDDPVGIVGDALLLRELVANLLDNAIRYTPAEGTVSVKVDVDDHRKAILTVSDNGPGIPLADQERVFERFYRVEGTAPGGSGLGLAIVSEITAVHGADMKLQSTPGNGTSVSVAFNLAS
jgi:two-component system sensor histidine kinase TctE